MINRVFVSLNAIYKPRYSLFHIQALARSLEKLSNWNSTCKVCWNLVFSFSRTQWKFNTLKPHKCKNIVFALWKLNVHHTLWKFRVRNMKIEILSLHSEILMFQLWNYSHIVLLTNSKLQPYFSHRVGEADHPNDLPCSLQLLQHRRLPFDLAKDSYYGQPRVKWALRCWV